MSGSLEKTESVQKTILLAEDFKDNAFMMRRLLELCGYRAFIAEDGREAVEKALEIKPDLIILDISLPVMTGFEACEILKGNDRISLSYSFLRMTQKHLRSRDSL